MSFTSALFQASFHNNWTIAWQKKVLHLLTFSGTLQLFIKSAWQKMCYLLPHFSRLPVLLNKVYRTLFSLYAKSAWQKKVPGNQVPRFPHIPHPWPGWPNISIGAPFMVMSGMLCFKVGSTASSTDDCSSSDGSTACLCWFLLCPALQTHANS